MNTQDKPEHPILLFPAQEDTLTLLRPLLLQEVGQLQGVECHLEGVLVQVTEGENSRHGANTLGLTRSLQAGGERAAHVMTDLTHVLIQLVGLTILLREEISGRMHTDQIKYAISSKIQGVALMAMHASFST